MATFDTFDKLKAELQLYMNKKNQDTIARIPGFIELCEEDIREKLQHRKLTQRDRATLSGQYLALPDHFGGIRGDVKLISNPERTIRYETPDRLTEMYPSDETGLPQKFTIQDDQLRFAPYGAGSNQEVEITYYVRLLPLSDTNTTNYFLANNPSLYLYGSLIHSAGYVRNPELIPMWEGLYSRGFRALAARDQHDRWSSGPLTSRPRAVA